MWGNLLLLCLVTLCLWKDIENVGTSSFIISCYSLFMEGYRECGEIFFYYVLLLFVYGRIYRMWEHLLLLYLVTLCLWKDIENVGKSSFIMSCYSLFMEGYIECGNIFFYYILLLFVYGRIYRMWGNLLLLCLVTLCLWKDI